MPDVIRSVDDFLNATTGLYKDNTSGDISAQDLRDFVISTYRPQAFVGHRLTTETGVTVSTSDRTSQATLYFSPHTHSLLGLYDGTSWKLHILSEIAIALASLTSGKNYDVFAFATTAAPSSTNTTTDIVTFGSAQGWATGSQVTVDATASGLTAGTVYFWNAASSTTGSFHTTLANALAGTSKVDLTGNVTANVTGLSLELSAAWTNDTTRADALTTQDGVLVKSGTTSRRYLGTIRTTGTTTTEDSDAKRFVWNQYNRVPRRLAKGYEGGSFWSYSSTTVRQANANSAHQVEAVNGQTAWVDLLLVPIFESGASNTGLAGIGFDSTSAFASDQYATAADLGGSMRHPLPCRFAREVALGYHYYSFNEASSAGGAAFNFFADRGYGRSGCIGSIEA